MTDSSGIDNTVVQLSTIDLTNPGDQKNATIIKQKITYYKTTLSHNQKIYNRWYYSNLVSNYTIHVINFILGILLSIQYYLPASNLIVLISSIIQIVLTVAYSFVYMLLLQSKINNFLIIVNSLTGYINQVTIFYNKAVSGGTITDSEMTDFNNMVAPLDKNLASEIQTANSNSINMSEILADLKSQIDGVMEAHKIMNTTKINSS